MNWVAVDLGASTIKASVLDKGNNPVRLSYPMGDYTTTLLSSVVVVTEDKKVIMGDYASQLGVSNPNMRVRDWLAGQDFVTQYEFGIKVLERFMGEIK